MHRTNDSNERVEQARYIGDQLQNSRVVELPGEEHAPFAGDGERVLRELQASSHRSRKNPSWNEFSQPFSSRIWLARPSEVPCSEEEQDEAEHRESRTRDRQCHDRQSCRCECLRQQVGDDEPKHRAGGEAEAESAGTAPKASTKRNAGTAISGCGRLEKMLQRSRVRGRVPRGTRTRLIASPSGMLWTAIASAIRTPERLCRPPKATPMPTPSANE